MIARKRIEDGIQAAIIGYLKTVLDQSDFLIYATPNASIRKANGTAGNFVPGFLKGVSDLTLLQRGGFAHYLEVKTDQPGSGLTEEQRDFGRKITAMGFKFAVVRSIDDVREVLALWGINTREIARR